MASLASDLRKRQAPWAEEGTLERQREVGWVLCLLAAPRDGWLCYPLQFIPFPLGMSRVATALNPPERLSLWLRWHQGNLLSFLGGWVHPHCRADPAFLPGTPDFP